MTDQIRGMSGAMGADAYRARDFTEWADESLAIANEYVDNELAAEALQAWDNVDTGLARRIVAGEYIGRHEGVLDDEDRPSGPARYAKPDLFAFAKREHLRRAQQRILNAVRRSQP